MHPPAEAPVYGGYSLSSIMKTAAWVHIVCMGWTILQKPGVLLPPLGIIFHVAAITTLAASHALLHLGGRNAFIFMVWCVVVEWALEQLNVWYDGFIFGRLVYSDQAGPKLIDIPIIVPFCFASLVWPSIVIVSLLLHDRVCYFGAAGESWFHTLFRSALVAAVHTMWSPSVEPLVVKQGVLTYTDTPPTPGADPRGPIGTFLFVPMSEFRSWFLMALLMVVGYSRARLTLPPPRKPSFAIDSAPLVLFGMFALWLTLRPVDNTGGLFALFTMTFCVAMAAYKLMLLDLSKTA